ncbi:MAG TPA: AAA family ATPase, partial [Myxococcota bacterium]
MTRALARVQELLQRAAIMLLGDDGKPAPPARRSTGIAELDMVLGGGLVAGRVVELFGPPGGGKTSLALALVAAVQQAGGNAAFIDVEGTLDPARAERAGVDLKRLIAAAPAFGEEALQMVDALLRAKSVDLVIVDSVAALVPRAELNAPVGESPPGLHARLMSQSLRRLVATASHARASI